MQTAGNSQTVPMRSMCTDCGVSRTHDPARCGRSCQFIQPNYAELEVQVHGRERRLDDQHEKYFGPVQRMLQASLKSASDNAQWTGITTRIGELLLQHNHVDAVLTVTADAHDRWKPVPVLVTAARDMARCRGMRMGYGPLLELVEPAIEQGIRRLAVIGIPCQVYALRSLESELKLDRLYVVGTPCSDNTTTENFHDFLGLLSDRPETIKYLEFRADYRVEIRFDNGEKQFIPFLKLPISKLPPDFFPLTCRTCVDYTNTLSDITVGYMGGNGEQWLLVRNDNGQRLLDLIADELTISEPITAGNRRSSVNGFKRNVERAAGGLPLRSMPDWMRPVMAWLMPRIGPKGLEFARARVEMKAIETVLHLRREKPRRMKHMIPEHVWNLARDYGITKNADE